MQRMNQWRLALRLLRRDCRRVQFLIIGLALITAVAAITAVGVFTDRVRVALETQASALLAADLAVIASRAIPSHYLEQAAELELASSSTMSMRSVVGSGERLQLVELKAVGPRYPLRGEIHLARSRFGTSFPHDGPPPLGEVWVEGRLLELLELAIGTSLRIGAAEFMITKVLVLEPDRAGEFFNIAPRVLMNVVDLDKTRLLLPGSRVQHRLLLAGDRAALQDFAAWVPEDPGLRVVTPTDARPEMKVALDRAQQFLNLAALVALVLAGAAIALSAYSFSRDHLDTVAVLRTLGASRRNIGTLFVAETLLFGLIAATAGALLGLLLEGGIARALAGWTHAPLPAATLWPMLRGVGGGCVALLGFSLPTLLLLTNVPPARVLRRDLGGHRPSSRMLALTTLVTVLLFAPWGAGDAKLTVWVVLGLAAAVVALAVGGYGALCVMRYWRNHASLPLRTALAQLTQRRSVVVVQIVALGLGIMALQLLGFIRGDLLANWRASLPPNASDQFLINIQPDERTAMADFFRSRGLEIPQFYPMIRGRLIARNGTAIEPAQYQNPRAQRLVEREFNLSYAEKLKPDNRLLAGEWWTAHSPASQFSVEAGIAETLGIALGDVLTYQVADRQVQATVTSLRGVDWDNLQVNFFVVAPPPLLRGHPTTYITSFKLPTDKGAFLATLVRSFPSTTAIDVRAMLAHVRNVMDRSVAAVEYVFLFTLAAGIIVLFAAVQASQAERVRDATIMRTLGSERGRIAHIALIEFALIGAIAGAVGSLMAIIAAWIIADRVLHLPFTPALAQIPIGVGLGLIGVTTAGAYAVIATWRTPVAEVLRRVD